jgi:hypothetical protein
VAFQKSHLGKSLPVIALPISETSVLGTHSELFHVAWSDRAANSVSEDTLAFLMFTGITGAL